MFDIKITAIAQHIHYDLMEKYENPITHACTIPVGSVFISHDGTMPEGFCASAWSNLEEWVVRLANGEYNFYDGWMKDPYSAMISCNDGFRPVSFYLETIRKDEK